VEWPTIVDERLRLLVEVAERAEEVEGASSANELLAALVCMQSLDSKRVGQLINRYRAQSPARIAAETRKHGGAPIPRRGRPRLLHQPDANEGSAR
jgi:hypothetical protein